MSPDRRRVDQHLGRRAARRSQGIEDIAPHALGRPAHEPVVQGLSRPIHGRGIGPAAAGLQHMHDAADHPAVIDPGNTSRVCRKMRRKPRELIVGKPEIRTRHHKLPSGSLNHASARLGIPFMGPEPKIDVNRREIPRTT